MMSEEKEVFGTEPNTDEVVNEAEEVTEVTEETAENITVEEVVEVSAEEAEVVEAKPAKKVISKVYVCDACGAIGENGVCEACGKELSKEDAYLCKSAVAVEKSKKRNKVAAIVVGAVVVVAAAVYGGSYVYKNVYNPYNHSAEYKDLAFGDTLEEFTEANGMDLAELLKANGLPEDMSKTTYVNIAQQYTPVKFMMEQYGMTVQDYLDQMGIEGEFDDNVTLGEVQGEATVEVIFGVTEENLAEIKEQYRLDDSVTLDTKFKDIRAAVMRAQYEDEQAEEAEQAKAAEETSDEKTDVENEADTAVDDVADENTEAVEEAEEKAE